MLIADSLRNFPENEINGKWVLAKPIPAPFKYRLHDAIQVLKGNAEAVRFLSDKEVR